MAAISPDIIHMVSLCLTLSHSVSLCLNQSFNKFGHVKITCLPMYLSGGKSNRRCALGVSMLSQTKHLLGQSATAECHVHIGARCLLTLLYHVSKCVPHHVISHIVSHDLTVCVAVLLSSSLWVGYLCLSLPYNRFAFLQARLSPTVSLCLALSHRGPSCSWKAATEHAALP